MYGKRTTPFSVSMFTESISRSACSILNSFGSLTVMVAEMFYGVATVTTGSAAARSLKVSKSVLTFTGAVALGVAAIHRTPGPRNVSTFLTRAFWSIVSYHGAASSNTVGFVPNTDRLGEASELLGSLIPMFIVITVTSVAILVTWAGPGGSAWSACRLRAGRRMKIAPGPSGVPVLGCAEIMRGNAHRKLANLASEHSATKLMAFSVGCTRIVITSDPVVAREMLIGSAFAERPLKEAAEKLLFARAMGFAAPGPYWRRLRKIAASSLFCPKQIAAHKDVRQEETHGMLQAIKDAALPPSTPSAPRAAQNKPICLRSFLQRAAVNNMMRIVFGCRYEFGENVAEAQELEEMIRGCFDVLGAFNWADHFPGLRFFDILHVGNKCRTLVPRVKTFVQRIINEHRGSSSEGHGTQDFVDVLLALEGEEKLSDEDMISVLWEMIFRGTDTIAVLTEWALAEMVLHPKWQKAVQDELDNVVGLHRVIEDADIESLPSLQAVLKETLRMHPPGPLLSWARLATEDVKLGGYDVPKGTTAMVNMWAITHDPEIWQNPSEFCPDRFLLNEVNDFDVRGGDLRLAPFGAGRRVCPGRSLGLATSHLWLARLLHQFSWTQDPIRPVDLTEDLKLSCEMAFPLHSVPYLRTPALFA